jgi:hypothetical protein
MVKYYNTNFLSFLFYRVYYQLKHNFNLTDHGTITVQEENIKNHFHKSKSNYHLRDRNNHKNLNFSTFMK